MEADAVVVGSGPNGLAGAVALARAGLSVTVLEAADEIGGGARTAELTLPGLLHDTCSGILPFALASPYLSTLPLQEHGLRWRWPEVDLAHPLDDGRAGALLHSLDDTAAGMGGDGERWRRLFEPLADHFDALVADLLGPLLHVPSHPVQLARFGPRALLPASTLVRRWERPEVRALFGGVAAHAFWPLHAPTTGALGLVLTAAAHAVGWPVAEGGAGRLTEALASLLRAHGGRIETGTTVTSLSELPPRRVTLLDVSPRAAMAMAGDDLPPRVRRAYRRFRHGPAAFKVDLAIEGEVPWTAEAPRRAGTVHLGGTFEEIAAGEKELRAGRMPARPFVLVGQQHLADPSRSIGDVHPLWAYAHVPHGYDGDATTAVLEQIERFAPGLRDRILATVVRGPADLARANPNYVGGDISTGANDPVQIVFRPRLALDPYATGIPGTFLCSAATPPGAGVHGMCGVGAARSALRHLGRAAAAI